MRAFGFLAALYGVAAFLTTIVGIVYDLPISGQAGKLFLAFVIMSAICAAAWVITIWRTR